MTNALFKKRQSRNRHRLTTHGMRPRLTVFRSGKHIYAQVIDDTQALTVASASTNEKDGKEAKIWLKDGSIAVNLGYSARELNEIIRKMRDEQTNFLEAWHDYFGA